MLPAQKERDTYDGITLSEGEVSYPVKVCQVLMAVVVQSTRQRHAVLTMYEDFMPSRYGMMREDA